MEDHQLVSGVARRAALQNHYVLNIPQEWEVNVVVVMVNQEEIMQKEEI